MYHKEIKEKVIRLRRLGKLYSEINEILGINIPKSTVATWCRGIPVPQSTLDRVRELNRIHLIEARKLSVQLKREQRDIYFNSLINKNKYYRTLIERKDYAKVALAMLYAGEGGKTFRAASLRFGNSDPLLIKLFLKLLKICYEIDHSKFRCRVQCRADQNTGQLEEFWYNVTAIPKNQFYKTHIDPRTVGKPSVKPDYKGVCNINYSSSVVFFDLMKTIEVITGQ